MANDPFDPMNSNPNGQNTGGNITDDPNFWHNLMAFGANTMTAANARDANGFLTYGAGPMGPIGAGITGAMTQARTNDQQRQENALKQAQAVQQQQQNQLFPLQMQQAQIDLGLAKKFLPLIGGQNPSDISPPTPSAGMTSSPVAGGTRPSAQTFAKPSANNAYHIRPTGESAGFIPSGGDVADENLFYKDILSKIDGSSQAMQTNFGKNYKPTLRNIVTTYAPPSENNTTNYLDVVSKGSGIDPDKNLRASDIPKIAPYFKQMEGGNQASTNPQSDYASQIAPNLSEQGMTYLATKHPAFGKLEEQEYGARTGPIVEGAKKQAQVAVDTDKDWTDSVMGLTQARQRLGDIANVFTNLQTGGLTTNRASIYSSLQGLGINVDQSKLQDVASVQQALHDTYVETLKELAANAKEAGSKFTQQEVASLSKQTPNPDLQPGANAALLAQSMGTLDHGLAMVSDWHKNGGLQGKQYPTDFQSSWVDSHPIEDFIEKRKKTLPPLKGMPGNLTADQQSATPIKGFKYIGVAP